MMPYYWVELRLGAKMTKGSVLTAFTGFLEMGSIAIKRENWHATEYCRV